MRFRQRAGVLGREEPWLACISLPPPFDGRPSTSLLPHRHAPKELTWAPCQKNAFFPPRVANWLSRFCPLQPPSSDLVTVLRKLGFDLSHGGGTPSTGPAPLSRHTARARRHVTRAPTHYSSATASQRRALRQRRYNRATHTHRSAPARSYYSGTAPELRSTPIHNPALVGKAHHLCPTACGALAACLRC